MKLGVVASAVAAAVAIMVSGCDSYVSVAAKPDQLYGVWSFQYQNVEAHLDASEVERLRSARLVLSDDGTFRATDIAVPTGFGRVEIWSGSGTWTVSGINIYLVRDTSAFQGLVSAKQADDYIIQFFVGDPDDRVMVVLRRKIRNAKRAARARAGRWPIAVCGGR